MPKSDISRWLTTQYEPGWSALLQGPKRFHRDDIDRPASAHFVLTLVGRTDCYFGKKTNLDGDATSARLGDYVQSTRRRTGAAVAGHS